MQIFMREFSIIKEKILQYLEYKGVSKYEFYQKTGVSNGILSQKNGISEYNLLKFLSVFNDISLDWLLLGKGTMLRGEEASAAAPETANSHVATLINILNNTLAEKDKQIDRLLSIIEKNNLNQSQQ